MSEPKSQTETILEHLKAGNSITPAEAFRLCGSLALHSRIAELRARGFNVRKVMVSSNGKRYGSYSLKPREQR